ncbi:MAG: biotin transporter BioY, partial [Propionicimonas sp.]|nr:biotin transporter BioY [Propionicimonas sp.]
AGGAAGVGVLAGPTAGYLVSFPLAAAVTGAVAGYGLRRHRRFRYLWLAGAALAGALLVTTPLGRGGLMLNAGLSLPAAATAAVAFLPGDVIKMLAAAAVALAVHKAFPAILVAAGPVPARP